MTEIAEVRALTGRQAGRELVSHAAVAAIASNPVG